jgi:hypothetical protein
MSKVIIFIPVSRDDHLDRLFASLEMLDCDAEQTSLLTYVDGERTLYERVQQRVEASKFKERLTHRRKYEKPTHSLTERRKRIAAIKNESKRLIGECDYVFGIEDDTIVPTHALSQLLTDYAIHPFAGFIEAVELGRWAWPYVGAWKADDVYEPTKLESLTPGEGVAQIDAGGFYCYLTKRENYMMHDYAPFGRNDAGPDMNFGLYLRQQGFKNYIDWTINCQHRMRGGMNISLPGTKAVRVAFVKEGELWKQIIEE